MESIDLNVMFGVLTSLIGTAIGIATLMWRLSKSKREDVAKLDRSLNDLSREISTVKSDLETIIRDRIDKTRDGIRREVEGRIDNQDRRIAKIETRLESGGEQMARIEERLKALPDNGDFSDLKAKQAEMVATLAGQTRTLDLIRESLNVDKKGVV